MNPVVRGETPWDQVWARDFWGHDQLASEESHKSWRPLCTASYRLNYQLAGHSGEPFWFHVVDRFLHALTSALALPVAALCTAPANLYCRSLRSGMVEKVCVATSKTPTEEAE